MFRNILRKTNSSCPVYHLQLYWKRTPTQRFLESNSIIFKIAGKHLWWNYLLVKDQKEFLDSTILSITLSRRLCFKKQLFQKSCRPTAYSCSFSKSELLANRKYWKMPWKGSVMELLCSKLQAFKLQPSFLLVLNSRKFLT